MSGHLEKQPELRSLLTHATVLLNEGVVIKGLSIWGSPVTPAQGEAFGMGSSEERARHWSRIPRDTDILVTHGPPQAIRDRPTGQRERLGDPELLSAVRQLSNLRLHVFGHVHGANGLSLRHEVTFANAALLGLGGGLEHQPLRLRMKRHDE